MKIHFAKSKFIIGSISLFLFVVSCSKFKDAQIKDSYLDTNEPDYGFKTSIPQMNAQIHLGRVLFYDKSLSKNNSIACASCHKQSNAFADNVAHSIGVENKTTPRNSIAIQNLSNINFIAGFNGTTNLFWDGRESSLQSLITKPVANHIEMGMDNEQELINKLNKISYYKKLVMKAYGSEEIDIIKLSESMSSFISQIRTDDSKFDKDMMNSANGFGMNALELRGMNLFNSTYECGNCHHPGPGTYRTEDFVNIGLDVNNNDAGRRNITNASSDEGSFKVPDLHNVALTAPYMHDGRFNTLDDVLEHYSRNIKPNNNLDDRLKNEDGSPISLNITSEDKKAIIAFLGSMTDYKMISNPNLSSPFKTK
jgi:cytochrome c peroxidase